MFSRLNDVLHVFKSPVGFSNALKLLHGKFVCEGDSLDEFLGLLIKHNILVFDQTPFEKPVFILAPPRSGSTLLFETLAASHHFCSIGDESHRVIESFYSLHPASKKYASNCLDETDDTLGLRETFLQKIMLLLKNNKGDSLHNGNPPTPMCFLEKTPKNCLRIPFIKKLFPNARFIYLYRDPKEIISSIMDGWRSGNFLMYDKLPDWPLGKWCFLLPPGWECLRNKSLAEIAVFQLQQTLKIVKNDILVLPEDTWLPLEYSRFIKNPEEEMNKIMNFLNIEMDPGLLDRVSCPLQLSRYTVSPPEKGKWKKNWKQIKPFFEANQELLFSMEKIIQDRLQP